MVVVGNSGSLSLACWALLLARAGNVEARLKSAGSNRRETRFDRLGVMNAGTGTAQSRHGTIGFQRGNRFGAVHQLAQDHHLFELLIRKGQPAFQFRVEIRLIGQRHGRVLERAGRRDFQRRSAPTADRTLAEQQGKDSSNSFFQMLRPSTMPTERILSFGKFGEHGVEIFRATHEVEMQGFHRKRQVSVEVVTHRTEVSGDEEFGWCLWLCERRPCRQSSSASSCLAFRSSENTGSSI